MFERVDMFMILLITAFQFTCTLKLGTKQWKLIAKNVGTYKNWSVCDNDGGNISAHR